MTEGSAAPASRLWSRRAALGGLAPAGALLGLAATRAPALPGMSAAPAKLTSSVTPTTADGLNVQSFGAKGNGQTDDAPAFQRALDQAQSSGIGLVVVPPGTYNVNATLTAKAPIRIAGLGGWSGTTIVFSSSLSTGLSITSGGDYPGSGIEVSGLQFEYGGSGNAVFLTGGYPNTLVSGCRFYLTGAGNGTGLYTTGQHDDMITQCEFYGSHTSAGTGIALDDTDNAKIIDNMFYKLGYGVYGIRGAKRVDDAGCLLVSNSMYGFTDALHFEGWELVQAIGNIVDGAFSRCFYLLDCYHSIIAENYLGINGTESGLLIETQQPYGVGFLGQITVRGNYLNHYEGTAGAQAIAVIGASATLPEDQITIEGNILNGYPDSGGIYLHNAQNVIVSMNTLNRASSTSAGAVSILDDTPGSNYIFNNVIDAPIRASGDYVENNFTRKPYPS